MTVNEIVRTQNTTYSNQLDKMREESNRLLEKVYKNPLYNHSTVGEEKERVEIVKMRVQYSFVSTVDTGLFVVFCDRIRIVIRLSCTVDLPYSQIQPKWGTVSQQENQLFEPEI